MGLSVFLLILAAVLTAALGQDSLQFLEHDGIHHIDGNLRNRLNSVGLEEGLSNGTHVGNLIAYMNDQPNPLIEYFKHEAAGDNTLHVSLNGTVTTRGTLDREISSANNLPVTFIAIYNSGAVSLTVSVVIKITVLDINDNSPVIDRTLGLAAVVPEDAAIGTEIFRDLRVTDNDAGWNAQIALSCYVEPNNLKSAEACNTFVIRQELVQQSNIVITVGIISVNANLDFENRKDYTMTIEARDNPNLNQGGVQNIVYVNIAIDVTDRADTLPVFSIGVSLRVFVHEHSPIGKRVDRITVRDGDEGNPRLLNITMIDISGHSADLFALDIAIDTNTRIYTITIVVTGDIDREQFQTGHTFQIMATEIDEVTGELTNDTTVVTIEVTIEDMNDNAPTFSQTSYNVSMPEPSTNGSIVPGLTLVVTDIDVSRTSNNLSYATFSVSIISQSSPEAFRLNNVINTGIRRASFDLFIENSQFLDYENPNYRTRVVTLHAVDLEDRTLTSMVVVTITIQDTNDNPPVFPAPSYSQDVSEAASPGTFIQTITATDADSGINAVLTYSLVNVNEMTFAIDRDTGVVTLEQSLDYDQGTRQYHMVIYATDGGINTTLTASTTLLITVLNYNDQPPVFASPSYRSTVTESSTVFLIPVTIQAADPDGNSVTYRIAAGNTDNNAFQIDPISGVLTLVTTVNYMDTPGNNGFFYLNVSATDNGSPPQVSYVIVTVEVRDENNAAPVFPPGVVYESTISEAAGVGFTVIQVMATDADSGTNGEIQYTITQGAKDDFKVNADNGIIYVALGANLDYDVTPKYNLMVEAVDRGSPPQTGTVTVTITVKDANNKKPVFDKLLYVQNLNESVLPGTFVVQTNAIDPDSTSSIQYSIKLSTILARDSSGNAVSTIFDYDYRNAFRISSSTGAVYTNATLDYDKASQIEFRVIANDVNATFEQTATASVLIYILQKVDKTPRFDDPWTPVNPTLRYVIPEERKTNFTYITLIAFVPSDKTQITNFEEMPGTDTGDYFYVERTTGKVRANRVIDYETLVGKMLTVTVKATSSLGLFSTAEIFFQIQDINDNAPVFLQPNYTFTVAEGKRFPEEVGNVIATDADTNSNANISFSLTGTNASHFTIFIMSNNLGHIVVSRDTELDYETTPQYNLVVHARDNPDINKFDVYKDTSVNLVIKLTDINDQKPIFSQDNYYFFTVETFGGSNVIGQVTATDRDSGSNGRVTYLFVNADTKVERYFDIFPNSGNVVTKTSLEGASVFGSFYVQVQARDGGNPYSYSNANIYINVSSGQLDNGQPVWIKPEIGEVINLYEHVPIHTPVFNASASPRTPGARINFSFLSNSQDLDIFAITPDGYISVTGDIDREVKAVYDLIIMATDSLNSTLQGTRRLTIRILDINDQIPSFRNCPGKTYMDVVNVNVRENLPAETFVYRVKACDLDAPPNNIVTYYFYSDDLSCFMNEMANFQLNSMSGVITTNVVLNREDKSRYRLCVQARPGSLGRKKRDTDETIQKIEVVVFDNNDNGPVFVTTDIVKAIFELPKQEAVTQLRAVDPDSRFFNKVRYSITKVVYVAPGRQINTYGAFNINPDTGLVTVNFPAYKAFTSGFFTISVRAEDYYNSTMFDTTSIKVYVAEEVSQVRIVIDTDATVDIIDKVKQMIDELNLGPRVKYQTTQIRYHRDSTGSTIAAKTDVCMLVIRNDEILDAYDGAQELDLSLSIVTQYGFREVGPCEPATTKDLEGWSVFWWVLVAFAIFIFILTLILMYALWALYRNYSSFMTTRQQYLVQ